MNKEKYLPSTLTNEVKVSVKGESQCEKNERKFEMLEMAKKGCTYQEIGETFHISKQRVYQIIGGRFKHRFKAITPQNCIYPNIRKWMNDNRITQAELTRRLYHNSHVENQGHVSAFLHGKKKGLMKSTIDKWLTVTGLTYEQLFEQDGE